MPSGLVELLGVFTFGRYVSLRWSWKGQVAVLRAQSHWLRNLEYESQFDLIEVWMQVSQSIDEERQYVIWLLAAFIPDIQQMIAYLPTRTY